MFNWFDNIKMKTKMLTVVILPLIASILIAVISISSIHTLSKGLIKNLFDETHQSVAWLLNADRDFYQALTAEMEMEKTTDPAALKDLRATYNENAKQATDRVHEAQKIINADKTAFAGYKHKVSGLSMFELFDAFDKDYAVWYSQFDVENNVLKDKTEYIKQFDSARERMNELEEILDVYGADVIKSSNKNTLSKHIIIFAVTLASVLIALLLGIIVIINIKRRNGNTLYFIK
jgi:methyl-accepting chemotaxis protein